MASFARLSRLTRCFKTLELHFGSNLLLVSALDELIRVPSKPLVAPWDPDFCFRRQIMPFFGAFGVSFGGVLGVCFCSLHRLNDFFSCTKPMQTCLGTIRMDAVAHLHRRAVFLAMQRSLGFGPEWTFGSPTPPRSNPLGVSLF